MSIPTAIYPRRTDPRDAATDGAGGLRPLLRPTGTSAPRSARSPRRPASRCRPSTTRSARRPPCSMSRSARRSSASTGGGSRRPGRSRSPSCCRGTVVGRLRGGLDLRRRPGHLRHARRRRSSSGSARWSRPCTAPPATPRPPRWSRRPRSAGWTPTARWCGSSPASPAGCAGVSAAAATDVVVVLFSAELYQALAVGRGWSHARCVGFFREVLTTQLLGAEA